MANNPIYVVISGNHVAWRYPDHIQHATADHGSARGKNVFRCAKAFYLLKGRLYAVIDLEKEVYVWDDESWSELEEWMQDRETRRFILDETLRLKRDSPFCC